VATKAQPIELKFGLTKGEQGKLANQINRANRKEWPKPDKLKGSALKGQTIACSVKAEQVKYGLCLVGRKGIEMWKGWCYYFCICIEETHESFWWNIDDISAWFEDTKEDTMLLPLEGALEYHIPKQPPFGWPFGLSPLETPFQGLIYCSENIPVRPHWSALGNLHPSGGESEGYYTNDSIEVIK